MIRLPNGKSIDLDMLETAMEDQTWRTGIS